MTPVSRSRVTPVIGAPHPAQRTRSDQRISIRARPTARSWRPPRRVRARSGARRVASFRPRAFWRCALLGLSCSEFVREHQVGLQSFRSMRRIDARRKKASALRLRFSQSLASLRQRLSHAMVRSTTQRRGKHNKSFGVIGALDDFGFEVGQIFSRAPSGIPVPDSRRRQTASSRTDTSRTGWQATGCRRRDPGYRRGERSRAATGPACLREDGASCP